MIRLIRWSVALGLALALCATVAAWAVANYSFSGSATTGGASQAGQWMNGTNALGVTVDKSVTPAKTYTHHVYVSDYTLSGTYTNDNACSASDSCLSNYYERSTNGGKTWANPVQLPRPANTPTERATLAFSGKTLVVAEVTQGLYYQGGGATFDVSAPRAVYVTRNTKNGSGSWSSAVKLPGQTASSRVDYVNAWAAGANVYVATTNVDTGDIWLWTSTDRGATWGSGPTSIGSTTFEDLATIATGGYVGGFSGLPTIAARGTDVVVSWLANPSGQVVANVSNNSGGSWSGPTTLEASGGADNSGYVQADAHDTRVAIAWTTASGAFVRIYDTSANTWGVKRTITAFPDTHVGGTLNVGGEGPMVALGPGSRVGVSISECNQLSGQTGCAGNLTAGKAREQLVWYASDDNGATWSAPTILASPGNAKTSQISNYGDAMYVKKKPLVVWNGHDTFYLGYTNFRKVGTPA
jgi:hypothetical protein